MLVKLYGQPIEGPRRYSPPELTHNAKGIKTTPAMAAGVSDHVWKLDEVVALLDE